MKTKYNLFFGVSESFQNKEELIEYFNSKGDVKIEKVYTYPIIISVIVGPNAFGIGFIKK